jgi:hypothetical protein
VSRRPAPIEQVEGPCHARVLAELADHVIDI